MMTLVCGRAFGKIHIDSGARKNAHNTNALITECGNVLGAHLVQYGTHPREFPKTASWCNICAPLYYHTHKKENYFSANITATA